MNFQEEFKTLQDKVRFCLRTREDTRNSDKTLTIILWRHFYPEIVKGGMIFIDNVYDLPSQDGIKRIRAHIQNDLKLYPPTNEEVARKRKWMKNEWRTALGYPPDDDEEWDDAE